MNYFDTNHDGKISFEEFKAALSTMRKDLSKKDTAGCEYKSYTKMMDDRYKNRRMANDLEEKYKVPLTFNQSVGFNLKDERAMDIVKCERYPIVLCNETKYADAMIKTGFPMW